MKISAIIDQLEALAPLMLQEEYDNAGLLTGSPDTECKGALLCLDVTEALVQEALDRNCNLIIAHHPIIFRGLKKITGRNYVERTVIAAIKNDVAIYAIHTNLDNIVSGVNAMIAEKLGLRNTRVLQPKENLLTKLYVFVPVTHAQQVRQAIFDAGAGQIGNYSECSFNSVGTGTFKAGTGTSPFVGTEGRQHEEAEIKIETIFPAWLQKQVINKMLNAHPYEEVAYDLVQLSNPYGTAGAGLIGHLPEPVDEQTFLQLLQSVFKVPAIRHSVLKTKPVRTVAVCGGAGSFLVSSAIAQKADFFVTSDLKYHEFFDADGRTVMADIGHFESEQYTIELLARFLHEKFPTFAALKTGIVTNPVHYFLARP